MSASQGSPASALGSLRLGSSQAGASTPGLEVKVRKAVAELLPDVDLNQVSVYKFRCMLARHLGLGKKGLEDTAEDVNTWIQDAVVFKAQLSTQKRNVWLPSWRTWARSFHLKRALLTFSPCHGFYLRRLQQQTCGRNLKEDQTVGGQKFATA